MRTAKPRPIASRSTALSARCNDMSIEVREVAHYLDEDPREPVHHGVISGIDQDIGLAADAHSTQSLAFGRVELDGYGKALRLSQPIATVLDRRQRAGLRWFIGTDAGSDAAHASLQYFSWHHVEHDR